MKPSLRKRVLTTAFVLFGLSACLARGADAPSRTEAANTKTEAPNAEETLSPDPALVSGTLPNGFRYYILPNASPQHQATVRLRVAAGSLQERDDQLGYAHFVEHMAFNGSQHFPPGQMVVRMQKLGMSLAVHANADTSQYSTEYRFDLPELSTTTQDEVFLALRDFCDGVSFEPAEVERERKVVFAEIAARSSTEYHRSIFRINALFPGSRLSQRSPMGTQEMLNRATSTSLAEFYRQNYTPARMVLVAVGDFDPKVMEARIKASFSTVTKAADAIADAPTDARRDEGKSSASVMVDKDLEETELTLAVIRPQQKAENTRAEVEEATLQAIGDSMINRRFAIWSATDNSAIESAKIVTDREVLPESRVSTLNIVVKDGRWLEALNLADRVLRASLSYPFNAEEFEMTRREALEYCTRSERASASMDSSDVAANMMEKITSGQTVCTGATDVAIVRNLLSKTDSKAAQQALKKIWGEGNADRVILSSREEFLGGNERLMSNYQGIQSTELKEFRGIAGVGQSKAQSDFSYDSFGTPGTVTSHEVIEDLGISTYVLSNGVRLRFKRMPEQKDAIAVGVLVGGGELSKPANSPGLAQISEVLVNNCGLGEYTNIDLAPFLIGHTASLKFDVGENTFNLTGTTTPADLKFQLQYLCAMISDPGFARTDDDFVQVVMSQYRKNVAPSLLRQLRQTALGPLAATSQWLVGGDPRFGIPDQEKLLSYDLKDLREWIGVAFEKAPLEICVVGDADEATLLEDMLATFGALPKRPAPSPLKDPHLSMPAPPSEKTFTFESATPFGQLMVLWPAGQAAGAEPLLRKLGLASSVLQTRLRLEVRQKLGASYAIKTDCGSSPALNNAKVVAICDAKPDELSAVAATITQMADEMAQKGITQDELDLALKEKRQNLAERHGDPDYWLTLLGCYETWPAMVKAERESEAAYSSITLEEVNQAAREYLGKNNALKVMIKNSGK